MDIQQARAIFIQHGCLFYCIRVERVENRDKMIAINHNNVVVASITQRPDLSWALIKAHEVRTVSHIKPFYD